MNNDNEPPSLMQFSSHSDEKLVINKSWPNMLEPIPPKCHDANFLQIVWTSPLTAGEETVAVKA